MPHTSRPCNPPYGIKFKEIPGDSWSYWSICQSHSHLMNPVDQIELKPGNPRFFREIQMQGDLCNIVTGTSTNDRQKSSRARAMSRPSTKPKPGNRRFFTKLIRMHQISRPYGSGSDRSTRNRRKSHVHVRCKAPPACTRQASRTRAQKPPKCTRRCHLSHHHDHM